LFANAKFFVAARQINLAAGIEFQQQLADRCIADKMTCNTVVQEISHENDESVG